jgi:hypothetical protein
MVATGTMARLTRPIRVVGLPEVNVPLLRAARRFSTWLRRCQPWQFALAWFGCLLVITLATGVITQWLVKGRFGLAFLFTYTGLLSLFMTGAATFSRQRQQRRRGPSAGGRRPWEW